MGAELEGLTVAAVAAESAKVAGGGGAAEPKPADNQGTTDEGRTTEGDAPDGAAGVASPEGGDAPAVSPEVQALVDSQVKAAMEKVRAEYEETGGHLSKLRSKKDKEIAKLRKELEQREQAEYQEALELARRDPRGGVERLAGMVDGMNARRQLEQQQAELQAWSDRVLEELGLDPDDDAVAEVVRQVGPLESEGASYAFLGEMGKLARTKEAEARKAAEKKLAQTLEGLPGLVNAAVAKQLAASGLGAVDGAEQQAPAQDNPIKNVDSPSKLLAMGWKAVGRKK